MSAPTRIGGRGLARAGIVVLAELGIAIAVYAGLDGALSATSTMSLQSLPLWAVLVGTAVVGGLLWLLRGPVDTLADRIVYGGRASGYAEARSLIDRLAASLPVDEVLPQLAATVGRAVHSPRAEVRCWISPGQRWQQVWPEAVTPQGDPLTLGVRHLGTSVGEIEVDQVGGPLHAAERRRLDRIAAPVGAALATVRLTHALRLRRAELERLTAQIDESTRRLLGARRAEQERFRGRLADRVLPLIDAALVSSDGDGAADLAENALREVRSLSRGIFPPRLADAGLATCLAEWAESTPARVHVDADEVQDPELRACLYFSVVTAGTALVASGAERTDVDIRRREDAIDLRIRTVGGGAPDWPLAARDRLEAFGATLTVGSATEPADGGATASGTVLTARVPADAARAGRNPEEAP